MTDSSAKKLTAPGAIIKHTGNDGNDCGETSGGVGLRACTESSRGPPTRVGNHPSQVPASIYTDHGDRFNERSGGELGRGD